MFTLHLLQLYLDRIYWANNRGHNYPLWFIVLCRIGFIFLGGISFFGESYRRANILMRIVIVYIEMHSRNNADILWWKSKYLIMVKMNAVPTWIKKNDYIATRLFAEEFSWLRAERNPSLLSYNDLFSSLMRRKKETEKKSQTFHIKASKKSISSLEYFDSFDYYRE